MATRASRIDSRDQYIESQIRKTRAEVRGVELASRLMMLLVATLAYFLLVAVLDHWVVPGGLGIWARLFFLAGLLIGGAAYLFKQIVPLFLYRINPIFAAHTIERSKPSLKNSLVNFLMLRSQRAGVPDVVYQAIEEQAAANLTQTPIDHAVDRSKVIHIGYVLLGTVVVFAAYLLFSPKSPLDTVGRVVLPWSDILPPTRVAIREIDPGTTTVFRGEHVKISAEILRLADDEPVKLYYSTADRQIVDQPVIMYISKSEYRHSCTLPVLDDGVGASPENGVQQDIEYRIVAGDAISHTYRLTVVQAPNIVVEKVDYTYPKYTGRVPETIQRTGDLRGLEGTQVTIHATANQPIKSAYLDFDGRGISKRPMKVDGQQASATLTLNLNKDRTGPEFANYSVRFVNDADRVNPEPVRYRIEVAQDYSPEIDFLKPTKTETDVPLDANVAFEVQASDPDFALSRVNIAARVGEQDAFVRYLLPNTAQKLATGRFSQTAVVRLKDIKLKNGTPLAAGDEIEYWAEAIDNKTPIGNATKTEVRRLRIGQPNNRQPNLQQEQQPDENNGGDGDPQNNPNAQQNPDQQRNNNQNNPGGDPQQPNNAQQNNNAQRNPNDPANADPNNANPNKATDNPPDPNRNDPANANQNPEQKDPNQKGDDNKGADNKGTENKGTDSKNGKSDPANAKNPQDNNSKNGDQQNNSPENNQSKTGDSKTGNGNQKNPDPQSGDQNAGKSGDQKNDTQKSDTQKNPAGQGGAAGNPGTKDRDTNAERSDDKSANQPQDKRPVEKEGEDDRAIQNILDHARDKEGKTPEGSENKTGQQNPAQQPDPAQNPADEAAKKNTPQDAGKKGTDQKGTDQKGTDQKGTDQKGTDQKGSDKAAGEKSGEQKNAGAKNNDDKNANQKTTDQKTAGQKSSDPKSDDPTNAGQKKEGPNEKTGSDKSGDQKSGSDKAGDQKSGSDKTGADQKNQPGQKTGDAKQGNEKSDKQGDAKQGDSKSGDASKQPGDKSGEQKSDGAKTPSEKSDAKTPDAGKSGADKSGSKEAGSKEPGVKESDPQQNPNNADQSKTQPDGKGAELKNSTGKRGDEKNGDKSAKQGTGKSNETPAKQEDAKPTDTKASPNEKSDDNSEKKEQSPGHGNKESKTEGASDGDKTGKGKKGGGQNDNKAGQGSAGSHESADDGAKKSKEPGAGEDGTKAGDNKTADDKTGKSSGDKQGAGSESRKSPDAKDGQSNEKQLTDKSADPNGKTSPQGDQGAKADPSGKDPQQGPQGKQGDSQGDAGQGDQPGNPNQQQPQTGKQSSTGQNADGTGGEVGPPPTGPLVDPGEDKANLEYAKKATDLALDHLRNQLKKGEPDQELLDKLGGWSKDDLASLLNRWEKMERDAQQAGPGGAKAKENLQDALRSLGLRPGRTARAATRNADDATRGLREAARSAPPPEYADQYRAFQKGTSRGGR